MARGSSRKAAQLISEGMIEPAKLCTALGVSAPDLVRVLRTPAVQASLAGLSVARDLLAGDGTPLLLTQGTDPWGLQDIAAASAKDELGGCVLDTLRRLSSLYRQGSPRPRKLLWDLLSFAATVFELAYEDAPPAAHDREFSPGWMQALHHALEKIPGPTNGKSAHFPPEDPPGTYAWCASSGLREYLDAAPLHVT